MIAINIHSRTFYLSKRQSRPIGILQQKPIDKTSIKKRAEKLSIEKRK